MTAAKIIEDLSLNSKGRYTISPLDFSKIEVALCESRSRFTYNASDGTLQFIKPTWIHACSSIWLKNWVYEMEHFGMVNPYSLCVLTNADLQGFTGCFAGRWVWVIYLFCHHLSDFWNSKKNSTAALHLSGRVWPTILLETGYVETDEDLISGTNLLLEGSKGKTGFVIVVKLGELTSGDQEIQNGYVELHKYNQDTRRRVRVGERQVILYSLLFSFYQ